LLLPHPFDALAALQMPLSVREAVGKISSPAPAAGMDRDERARQGVGVEEHECSTAAGLPALKSASSATSVSRKPMMTASSIAAGPFRRPCAANSARIPSRVMLQRSAREEVPSVIMTD
jgi:hypothetical protein